MPEPASNAGQRHMTASLLGSARRGAAKSGLGSTLANFRVEGPIDVARAINLLADLREGGVNEQ